MAVGESAGQAQSGEDDGEEIGELHDGDGGYYPGRRDIIDTGKGWMVSYKLNWKVGRERELYSREIIER